MKRVNYTVVKSTKDFVLIKDLGPWEKHPSVTNDAEAVVAEMAPTLCGRKLFYIDSEGCCDQLLVKDGKFNGFGPGLTRRKFAKS